MKPDDLMRLLYNMMRIRFMEETCAELYTQEKIRGFLHLYIGEEAVATGVLDLINPEDNVMATYREHGHALLKGISAKSIMSEMFGKVTGCSRGRGGSMHLYSSEHRFFGDGAMAEGAFHEAMNLAVLWNLPIIFCCENNLYAMGTALDRHQSQTNLEKKAESYKMATENVDGMNVQEVHRKTAEIINCVRAEKSPFFIEYKTYRFRAHSMFDPDLYRTKQEISFWKARCPIEKLKSEMIEKELIDSLFLQQMQKKLN